MSLVMQPVEKRAARVALPPPHEPVVVAVGPVLPVAQLLAVAAVVEEHRVVAGEHHDTVFVRVPVVHLLGVHGDRSPENQAEV